MNHWPECVLNGMEHPCDKEIQVCENDVPGVINGPSPEGHIL